MTAKERDSKVPGRLPEAATTPQWHTLSPAEALHLLDSRDAGLTEAEVRHRLARHGQNSMITPKRRGPLLRFPQQFHNILLYVMLASAMVTAALGHWVDTGVLIAAVLVNAVIGFIQEGRAEAALDAIRNMLSPHATVVRKSQRHDIHSVHLVPGDVVLLASGDRVPANLRLLKVHELRLDEAPLTGESLVVEKSNQAVAADASLGDRSCMAYSGTLVAYGQARGLVVGTDGNTELGRINQMLSSVQNLATHLLRQIDRFGRLLAIAILGLSAATFALGTLWRGHPAGETFMMMSVLMMAGALGLFLWELQRGTSLESARTMAVNAVVVAELEKTLIRRTPALKHLMHT